MTTKQFVDVSDPVEPVSLAEARAHLNLAPDVDSDDVESHPDDAQISAFITAAREWVEFATGCTIAERLIECSFDSFPDDDEPLELMAYPVNEVSSVVYTTSSGDVSSTDEAEPWTLDDASMPARLVLNDGQSWPTTAAVPNAVRVTLNVGFRAADAEQSTGVRVIPKTLRGAILLLAAHYYEHREDATEKALQEIPNGVQVLMRTWRYRTGIA